MATVTEPAGMPSQPMNGPEAPRAEPSRAGASPRFVLQGVSFATYRALRDDLDRANAHVRMTFDRGTLELMTLSFEHERESRWLFTLVTALAMGLEIEFEAAGSTTFSREDLDRGLEPDECFYIANEPRVRGLDTIDLANDPPPDLVIEVEVSRSSLDKLAISASLGVPEFWRRAGDSLEFLRLGADGVYQPIEASLSFPTLTRDEAEDWLRRRGSMRMTEWMRALNAWVRDVLAPRLRDQPGR